MILTSNTIQKQYELALRHCFSHKIQCFPRRCTLFEVSSKCVSHCSSCGTLCEAYTITDLSSLQYYSQRNCTVVVGDMYVIDTPTDIIANTFLLHLKTVVSIRGSLILKGIRNLQHLLAFQNLREAVSITLSNLPNLVDGRMRSLTSLSGIVTVEGCPRLCPSRYPGVGSNASLNADYCANTTLEYYVNVFGDANAIDLLALETLSSKWLTALSQNKVRQTITRNPLTFYAVASQFQVPNHRARHSMDERCASVRLSGT